MHPDDAKFLQAFEECTLPFAEWRHRAHIKVAYLYLCALPFDAALNKARANIKRYNAATNTPDGRLKRSTGGSRSLAHKVTGM